MSLPNGKTEQQAMNVIREAAALFTSETNVLYFVVLETKSMAPCTLGVHVTTQDHFEAMQHYHQCREDVFQHCATFDEAAALFKSTSPLERFVFFLLRLQAPCGLHVSAK